MARGQRINLADLAGVVGDKSPVELAAARIDAGPSRSAALR